MFSRIFPIKFSDKGATTNDKFILCFLFFRCPAQRDLGLVIELQTSSVQMPHPAAGMNPYFPPPPPAQARMTTKAWTKIQLFDGNNRLISGRWRLPLRITPIKPHLPPHEINGQPQVGTVSHP